MKSAELQLPNGIVALFDESDRSLIDSTSWFVCRSQRNWYVRTRRPPNPLLGGYFHCQLMGTRGVDHINGNGLDNRRVNLRLATTVQNHWNMRKRLARCSSRFKGVYFDSRRMKWGAQIGVHGRHIMLGRFGSEVEAAVAYNAAAIEHFGEFALVNEIAS